MTDYYDSIERVFILLTILLFTSYTHTSKPINIKSRVSDFSQS